MKSNRPKKTHLLLAAVILLSCSSIARGLEYHFKVGQQLRYKCSDVYTTPKGPESQDQWHKVLTVLEVLENGNASICLWYEDWKDWDPRKPDKKSKEAIENTLFFVTLSSQGKYVGNFLKDTRMSTDYPLNERCVFGASAAPLTEFHPPKAASKVGDSWVLRYRSKYTIEDVVSVKGMPCMKITGKTLQGWSEKEEELFQEELKDPARKDMIETLKKDRLQMIEYSRQRIETIHFNSAGGLLIDYRDQHKAIGSKAKDSETVYVLESTKTITPGAVKELLAKRKNASPMMLYHAKYHAAELSKDSPMGVRREAVDFFRTMDHEFDDIVKSSLYMPVLLKCLKDPSVSIRRAATDAIMCAISRRRRKNIALVRHLIPLLDDPDPSVREYALTDLPSHFGLTPPLPPAQGPEDSLADRLKRWWKETEKLEKEMEKLELDAYGK